MDFLEWVVEVIALEGASFAGGCNLLVLLFVVINIEKTKLATWGAVLRVSAFGLLTVMTLMACLGVLSYTGLGGGSRSSASGGVEAPASDNGAFR